MSECSRMEEEIRALAKQWLEDGEIKYFIGYERSSGHGVGRPVFVHDPSDVEKLIWDPTCSNNLCRYAVDEVQTEPSRGEEPDLRAVGIILKPCDSRTMVELVKENVITRDRVKMIGVRCHGVNDIKRPGEQAEKCAVCEHHSPLMADVVIGEEVRETNSDTFSDVKELEDMSIEERWEFWKGVLSGCVRCHACRDVCALCYCKECIFDRTKPYKWNEKSVKLGENMFYHIIRAMHLAGRCVDCGECEAACPMNIPLRKLNRFLAKRSKERFNVEAGSNAEDKSLFGTHNVNDPGEEIW